MLIVIHSCNHKEETPGIERIAKVSVEKKLKTQEQADQFVREQVAWLESKPCPYCYCEAKGIVPNPHPVPEA